MARWSFTVGAQTTTNGTIELTRGVTARSYTRRLVGPDEIGFVVNGSAPAAAVLAELETDCWAWRDSLLVARCRVLPTDDSVDDRQHRVSCKAFGYEALLDTRFTEAGDTLAWTGTDQAAIAWNLVNLTQSRTGGSLGITKGLNGFTAGGVANTGVLRDRTYQADQNIGKLLRQLSEVDNGFDMEIDASRKLQIYYPGRGLSAGKALVYGSNVSGFKRTFNYRNWSNAVGVSGGSGTATQYAATAGIATDPRGRVEARLALPSVTQDLAARATSLLAERSKPVYTWSLTMRQGQWAGFADVNVGDTCKLAVHRPPRFTNMVVNVRVHEISVVAGADGSEQVTMKAEQL
jgi:hypothetical protein